MDGILNIRKEKGYTSHDVVAKLRGILHQKKIGHTGTLDPDAEGVLPVCLGKGTKLCDLLTDTDKEYRAVLLLGYETDTQDMSGTILAQKPVLVKEEEVREAILSFLGSYHQTPPMYSALKVDGKKLYELARQGKTVERKSRAVTIHQIVVEEIELPRITMRISCSKGTYIRTLCHDIGVKLGCGGAMESLVRTRVGQFVWENSITLAEVESHRNNQTLEECVVSLGEVLGDLPVFVCESQYEKALYNGNKIRDSWGKIQGKADDQIRMCDSCGNLVAVYERRQEPSVWYPRQMFLP